MIDRRLVASQRLNVKVDLVHDFSISICMGDAAMASKRLHFVRKVRK